MRRAIAVFGAGVFTVFMLACSQTDAGVTTKVKSKLAADDTVKAYQIDVDTNDHVVTLSGNVESAAAKEQAVRLARETDGVKDVVVNIMVDEGSPAMPGEHPTTPMREDDTPRAGEVGAAVSDAALTTTVKSKLLADPTVSGLKIDVDTKDGVVTLTGKVKSTREESEALRIARNTDGVKRVQDKVTVSAN
jgi:hyperosmotically inducible periplasmic protein